MICLLVRPRRRVIYDSVKSDKLNMSSVSQPDRAEEGAGTELRRGRGQSDCGAAGAKSEMIQFVFFFFHQLKKKIKAKKRRWREGEGGGGREGEDEMPSSHLRSLASLSCLPRHPRSSAGQGEGWGAQHLLEGSSCTVVMETRDGGVLRVLGERGGGVRAGGT